MAHDAADRHSSLDESNEEVNEIERMIGAGGLRIQRHANLSSTQIANRILELSANESDTRSSSSAIDDDTPELIEYITTLRQRLSIEELEPSIDEILKVKGIIERLIEIMRDSILPILKLECAWCLSNIASGTTIHTRAVIDANAIPVLVKHLKSENQDVRDQSVWALGNIAGDSVTHRDLVLASGALPFILHICEDSIKLSTTSTLRNATWTISNLCRGQPQLDFNIINTALPVLARMIFSTDDEILVNACWSLAHLSDSTREQIRVVFQFGIARRLIELLIHKNSYVISPAIRTISNVASTGNEFEISQVLIILNIFSYLPTLMEHSKKGIRRDACRTLSYITAGNHDQIQGAIDGNLISPLIKVVMREDEIDYVAKEAAMAICNISTGGTKEQIQYLAQQGVIELFCQILDRTNLTDGSDAQQLITTALKGLKNFLRSGANSIESAEPQQQQQQQVNPYLEMIKSANGRVRLERVRDMNGSRETSGAAEDILVDYFAGTRTREATTAAS